jgi:predicted alpha/beta superfamily hydrolase
LAQWRLPPEGDTFQALPRARIRRRYGSSPRIQLGNGVVTNRARTDLVDAAICRCSRCIDTSPGLSPRSLMNKATTDSKPPAEISIPNTRRLDFVSKVNQHRYSISVALPLLPPPAAGYRVLYLLDGYAYFATAVEATRSKLNAPDVIVVGIGYPDDAEFIRGVKERHAPLPAWMEELPSAASVFGLERFYDLSLPATDAELAAQNSSGLLVQKASSVGGLDDFLKTIESEIKPRVAALAPVDPANQAIFGHSLGGLAVVHALFVEPNAFRTFIAASPSIWWNRKVVLAGEAKFSAAVRAGQATPRVLITMGATEDVVEAKLGAKLGIDPVQFEAMIRDARMVENARELTQRLQALRGSAAYEVEDYALFDKQGHGISPWPALGRAIDFAFPLLD